MLTELWSYGNASIADKEPMRLESLPVTEVLSVAVAAEAFSECEEVPKNRGGSNGSRAWVGPDTRAVQNEGAKDALPVRAP